MKTSLEALPRSYFLSPAQAVTCYEAAKFAVQNRVESWSQKQMCETLCSSVSLAEVLPNLFSEKCFILFISFSLRLLIYGHQSLYSVKFSKNSHLQCNSFHFALQKLTLLMDWNAEAHGRYFGMLMYFYVRRINLWNGFCWLMAEWLRWLHLNSADSRIWSYGGKVKADPPQHMKAYRGRMLHSSTHF
jgi:hypothetical protein